MAQWKLYVLEGAESAINQVTEKEHWNVSVPNVCYEGQIYTTAISHQNNLQSIILSRCIFFTLIHSLCLILSFLGNYVLISRVSDTNIYIRSAAASGLLSLAHLCTYIGLFLHYKLGFVQNYNIYTAYNYATNFFII